MMPRFLGVSPAVIENVIFCHQEDSLWPMAPPNDLKKKFDEIFEAHKYTKAIDNIKVLQKNKKIELTTLKQDEAHCKQDNTKAKDLKVKILQLDAECKNLRDRSQEFGDLLRTAEANWMTASDHLGQVERIVGQLVGKRIQRNTKDESVKELRKTLTEMPQSDDELQNMLEQYDEQIQDSEKKLNDSRKFYHDKESEVKSARNLQSAKERECGSHEAQKETYDRQIDNRNRLIQESARSHDIRGYDMDIGADEAREFLQAISKKARDQQAEYERVRDEVQEQVQNQMREVTRLGNTKSRLQEAKFGSRQKIDSYDVQIDKLRAQKDELTADEGAKVTIDAQLLEAQTKFRSAKSELQNAPWLAEIDSTEASIAHLDEGRDKLDAEQADAARRAGDTAQLDFVKRELADRNRSLETMVKAHTGRITAVIGNWSPKTIEEQYQRAVNESMAMVKDAEKQRDGVQVELDNVSSRLRERNASLKDKQDKVKAADEAIKKELSCDARDYPDELLQREEARENATLGATAFVRLEEFLEASVKHAQTKNCCKLCMREFENERKMEHMLVQARKLLANCKDGQDSKEDIEEIERDYENAKAARKYFDDWERLTKKDIPELKQEEQKFEEQRRKLLAELEDRDMVVKEKTEAKREVDAVLKTVTTIKNYHVEINNLKSQDVELSEKQAAAGLSRGIEAIQADIKKLDEERKGQKGAHAEAVSNRDRKKNLIATLELQVSNLTGKREKIEYDLKHRQSLDSREEEYKTLKANEREAIRALDEELRSNASDMATEQAKYDDVVRRGADRDREQQDKAGKLNNSVNKLNAAEQEIKAYIARGGDTHLHRVRREKEEAESDVARIISEQQQIARNIKKLEIQSSDSANTKRSIVDNQRYRRDLRDLDSVQTEIAELEQRNAEDEHDKYSREVRYWQQQRNELSAKQASVIGEAKGLDDQLRINNEEYQKSYKDSHRKFKAAHIMVETTKAAINDLGLYSGALDKAIMKFHTMKMEQINAIIDELWRKTYQGTDVDTVMIRSESETVRANKSYNYRVVMVKQDTEMDMRGRCSAGQKVLAAIIVRLALAEVFGNNCGVIALDEPTTNLDADNIRALAGSLSEIIKSRRAQHNFQLIVITHDEEFLQAMGCNEFTDTYFRVSRDDQQHTMIKKQSIAEVM